MHERIDGALILRSERNMERILIPTDFSEMAQNALDYGVRLARRKGARITVMHTVQKPMAPPQGPVRDRSDIPKEDEESLALWEELESITDWIRQGSPEIEKVTQKMPSGFPGDEILKTVEEEGVDLVVMGTKGEKGFSDSLMGTTASNVIQKASCDVLTVPQDARFKTYEQAAYASNLNEKDPQALKQLLDFLDNSSTKVDAVHVLDEDEEVDKKSYERFQEGLRGEGIVDRVGFERVRGARLEEVLDAFIDEKGVDLLSMLNESRNFLQRLFHNSKSKKMAFHSKVPLLILHRK